MTHVVWDRLFGTFHEGTDPVSQSCPIGYEGHIYNKNKWIADEFFYPMVAFFKSLYEILVATFAPAPLCKGGFPNAGRDSCLPCRPSQSGWHGAPS